MERKIEIIIEDLAIAIQKVKILSDELIVYKQAIGIKNTDTLKSVSIIDFIIALVAERENISISMIKSKSCKNNVVIARHLCMILLKNHTLLSHVNIGKQFNKDHSAVCYAINKIKDYIEVKDKTIIHYDYYTKSITDFRNSYIVAPRHTIDKTVDDILGGRHIDSNVVNVL